MCVVIAAVRVVVMVTVVMVTVIVMVTVTVVVLLKVVHGQFCFSSLIHLYSSSQSM